MIEKYSHVRAEAKRRAVQVFDEGRDREGPPKNHHIETESGDNPITTN